MARRLQDTDVLAANLHQPFVERAVVFDAELMKLLTNH
jgi:hypothetical protein